jgi:TfoX/Sxy family transcriptional regulator of competence genes
MPELGDRIRAGLAGGGEITESRVLGGTGYFVDGILGGAVIDDSLCIHVDLDQWQDLVDDGSAQPLLFVDRPVPGWLLIPADSVQDDHDLAIWLDLRAGV